MLVKRKRSFSLTTIMPGPSNPPKRKAKKTAFAKQKKQGQNKKNSKGKAKETLRTPSEEFSSDDDNTRKKTKRGNLGSAEEIENESDGEPEIYANDKAS